MFCPNCRSEFLPGVTECGECNVALVDALPPEVEYQEPVTVFQGYGPSSLPVAESILRTAGIPYNVRHEDSGEGFGVGGVSIQVPPENAEAALELLSDLESAEPEPGEST